MSARTYGCSAIVAGGWGAGCPSFHHRGVCGELPSSDAGGAVAELPGQQPGQQRIGDRVGFDGVEQVITQQLRGRSLAIG